MVVPGATPEPTSTLPGVKVAAEPGDKVRVVPEIVAPGSGRVGAGGSTERSDEEVVTL